MIKEDVWFFCRLLIGKGVQLDLWGEGDVWLHCLSNQSVYVQSHFLYRATERDLEDVADKIDPTVYIKVTNSLYKL